MTNSFILRKEEAPVCVAFNVVITVKHILIECSDLVEMRERNILRRDLCIHFFWNVIPEVIFFFPERDLCVLQNMKYVGVMFV